MESQFNYLASAMAFGSYFILRRIIKRITIKHAQKRNCWNIALIT